MEYYLIVLKIYLLTLMLNVNLLTKGSAFLTYQENTTIFNHVFSIIYTMDLTN
jgi:hypothetical protein